MVESGIISGVFDEAVSELSYFLLERTRLVLCTMHTQPGVRLAAQTAPKTWSIAYSDNLVHAKFMILFFKKYCRIIIASGNFTQVEWTTIRQVRLRRDFRDSMRFCLTNIDILCRFFGTRTSLCARQVQN